MKKEENENREYTNYSEYELYIKISEIINYIEKTKRDFASSKELPNLEEEYAELATLKVSAAKYYADITDTVDEFNLYFEYWLNYWHHYARHNLDLKTTMEITKRIENNEDYSEFMLK